MAYLKSLLKVLNPSAEYPFLPLIKNQNTAAKS
jgi:hypothetical protein